MFINLCCYSDRWMKMLNPCNNKTNSQHKSTQLHAYSCNNLYHVYFIWYCFSFNIYLMYLIFKYVLYMYVYMRNNKQKTSLFLLKIHVVNLTLKYCILSASLKVSVWSTRSFKCAAALGWFSLHCCTPTHKTNVYCNWFHESAK